MPKMKNLYFTRIFSEKNFSSLQDPSPIARINISGTPNLIHLCVNRQHHDEMSHFSFLMVSAPNTYLFAAAQTPTD